MDCVPRREVGEPARAIARSSGTTRLPNVPQVDFWQESYASSASDATAAIRPTVATPNSA